jgi:hypothetical protein
MCHEKRIKKIRTIQPFKRKALIKNPSNTVGARLDAFYFHPLARSAVAEVIARTPL